MQWILRYSVNLCMKFITGIDRNQSALFPVSLEQSIDADNEVRIIDLFADSLPLQDYGFEMEYVKNGRPAYHPSDLHITF